MEDSLDQSLTFLAGRSMAYMPLPRYKSRRNPPPIAEMLALLGGGFGFLAPVVEGTCARIFCLACWRDYLLE